MKKIIALLLALTLVFALSACGSSEETSSSESGTTSSDKVYHIGIIQAMEHVALDNATQGFEDALTDLLGEDNVDFNLQNAQGEPTNCATIANSLVSSGVDLILANATNALQAAQAATAEIPVLGTSVTDYATALDIDDWTGTVGNNVSGTSDLAPLDQQAQMLADLCPVEKYPVVGMVYCSAEPNSVYQINEVTGYLKDMGYETEDFAFADSNDIASVVTNACEKCNVLYIPTDNTAAENTETIYNVTEPAGIPVIAGEEGICSGCGVATLSIDYYDLGYTTGEMAYEILVNGEDVSKMEVKYCEDVTKEYVPERCEALGIEVSGDFTAIEES